MHSIKRRPMLLAGILAWVAVVALEAAWLAREMAGARRALRSLEQKRQERETMIHLVPAPSEATAHAIEAELAAARLVLGELRELRSTGGEPASTSPLDEYLAISRFVEELRTSARGRQVVLRADERFGMASYQNEGPPAGLVAAVQRQRAALRELLSALFAAGPRELLAVKRERLNVTAMAMARPEDSGAAADYFTPAMRARGDAHGVTHAQAFQVEFSGTTPVLRDFMNALAESPVPLSVRCVEVDSIPSREPPNPGMAAAVLVGGDSKFSVTVDCVEWQAAEEGAP